MSHLNEWHHIWMSDITFEWVMPRMKLSHETNWSAMSHMSHINESWHLWISLQVSFAKEPYTRDYILKKRPVILHISHINDVTFMTHGTCESIIWHMTDVIWLKYHMTDFSHDIWLTYDWRDMTEIWLKNVIWRINIVWLIWLKCHMTDSQVRISHMTDLTEMSYDWYEY